MAARWAAGDETLTACNMEYFYMDTLDEPTALSSRGTLDALHNTLDPSILSLFEDSPTIETKAMDEESEATLLSALTEILDNVDDENLSPFDTLPDSDLLSAHKGREHSPLRRLLCLSRSPPDKDALCRPSRGKSLPRIQADCLQRSDGEEEDGSLTLSPVGQDSPSHYSPLDWGGLSLPLPVTFEQEDEASVSLGDLVRQMHPYCLTFSVESEEGEQLLPEGGILLEVVDQGENGEPILAIPNVGLPVCLPHKEHEADNEEEEEGEAASDTSEHVVVDDVAVGDAPVKAAAHVTPDLRLDMKTETITKRPKERSSSRRKKKKRGKKKRRPVPVEPRVLRSGKVMNATEESPKTSRKSSSHKEKSLPKVPVVSAPSSSSKPNEESPRQNEEDTSTLLPTANVGVSAAAPREEASLNANAEESRPSYSHPAARPREPDEEPKRPPPAPEKPEGSSAAPSAVPPPASSDSPAAAPGPGTPPVSEVPAASEPKAKSLSLAEYRRLRQQKKPPLAKHQENLNTSKWPRLPELPKELLPIPDLPAPSAKDPRCASSRAVKNVVDEVKPAWQPCGPCAPPTPEALLVPPAYMVSSSNRASAAPLAPKPQPTPEPARSPPSPKPSSPASNRETSRDGRIPQSQAGSPQAVGVAQTDPDTTTLAVKSAPAPRKITVVFQKVPEVRAPTSMNKPIHSDCKSRIIAAKAAGATQPAASWCLKAEPVVTTGKPQKTRSPAQKLVEAFTSEIGIEAADMTSLLEQFEETQAKEERSTLEFSGRAAAVGSSSVALVPEKTLVERVRANDLSSATALTPPGTPPHQMWKPVALPRKSKASEPSRSSPAKVIQIEARPLPAARSRSKPTSASVSPEVATMDHDYCLPSRAAGEPGTRWNVKPQPLITIKAIKTSPSTARTPPAPRVFVQSANTVVKAESSEFSLSDEVRKSSVLETPDASPSWQGGDASIKGSPKEGASGRTNRQHAASRTPSPASSPKERTRGQSRKRSRCSPSSTSSGSESDSHSSRSRSRSGSPSKKRYRPRHSHSSSSSSRSSSCSSSGSRSPPRRRRRRGYAYTPSRSGSWSRSRSRSRSGSPQKESRSSRSRRLYRPSFGPSYAHNAKAQVEKKINKCKERAIEERRVVYVGRIRGTMTQNELRERFSLFGDIEDCTLHFRDHGDNYGFVTYYNIDDAFNAIKNGGKLRRSDELPFDICFGGRRQFCRTSYADLDSILEYDPLPANGKFHALDFDTLLKQAKQSLKR
ncbi:peroxisome proliferator-activated receptor gamma coactivator-related protein 1 [Brachionichthys hirsutus]|uniref:peroxisome proliferator-activated receptor gamma coactivator-related protein 1 n=1 Tax=Brachionichthys hirsutus TaxID=412623 RepID=UPI003604D95C